MSEMETFPMTGRDVYEIYRGALRDAALVCDKAVEVYTEQGRLGHAEAAKDIARALVGLQEDCVAFEEGRID